MIAEVAELVDALGSGSSRWTPVGVRVPSSAPRIEKRARFQYLARFHFGLGADRLRMVVRNQADRRPIGYFSQTAP